eukprot:TRINITY_DN435_c0_g1_i2.p2 TRINITY_DN435_c0_g1~~TRINITY_DN435_c0_g1_i2.p2  ORF type:complete len:159 (-),score=78.83 TRINITY_DN435_c0_g1_i2:133-573(-)
MPSLEVIATGYNVKKLDPAAYGIKDNEHTCVCKLKLGSKEVATTALRGLDAQWPEETNTWVFEVADPAKDQLEAVFQMGPVVLGQPAVFLLGSLKKGVATYKGFAPPGGKVDLSIKALDFGKEAEEEQPDESWMEADFAGAADDEC